MSTYYSSASQTNPKPYLARSYTDPTSNISAGDGDETIRIKITTTHYADKPPAVEAKASDGSGALVGTLIGVAAGAAIGYAVGRDKQAGPTLAKAVQAAPAALRAIGEVAASQQAFQPPQAPSLARASTYHGDHAAPYAIEMPPSPPSEYVYQSPVSEARTYASGKTGQPLMIKAAPSHAGSSRTVTTHRTLPPSPPSSRSSAAIYQDANSRAPSHSNVSKSSSSTVKNVTTSEYRRPNPSSSRTSAASLARSAAVSAREPYEIELPPSTVASKGASTKHTSRQSQTRSAQSSRQTSASSASTVKPSRPKSPLEDQSDDGSLAPEDSISQVSSNKTRVKKKVHRHRKRDESESEGKQRSLLSLPLREIKREKDKRGISTQI